MVHQLKQYYTRLSAEGVVIFWFSIWWIANLITSGVSELSNDEAYYHIFAENLAWGYFDHPPMTALLVYLGEQLFAGELGVRFFFTLIQPLCLYTFWRVIRPAEANRRDGELYAMICGAMLILQLYGLVAVPDGALLLFTALFLLTFKHFSEDKPYAWLTMGISLGLLALSKYHGALVLLFALCANAMWLLRNPRKIWQFALSGVVALAIITPHLIWQHNHDWVSFAYHLSGRNGYFALSNITDFLVNMLVVFSPFYLPLWVQAHRKVSCSTPVERTLKLYPLAFIIFFSISSFRGYVQPQWAIVAVFGLIWLLFDYTRHHKRTRRYVMRAGWVTLALIAIVRVEMMFNPIGLKMEVFNNKESYGAIAELAQGRPIVFDSRYAIASKYKFYTSGEAFCQPNISHRTSQWQFRNDDSEFIGREVLVEVNPDTYYKTGGQREINRVELANGNSFNYVVVEDFRPTRKVEIISEDFALAEQSKAGDEIEFSLQLHNPYNYPIYVDGKVNSLEIVWGWRKQQYQFFPLTQGFTLPAGGSCEVECRFIVPQLKAQPYKVGFALRNADLYTWFNSKDYYTEIE